MARALYQYTARKDDELSFKKDDIITVITKKLNYRGWWKGKLNGKSGIFLSNMVEIISNDETVSVANCSAQILTTHLK